MPFPELWIVAGPNGAGKTTCTQKEPISFLLPKVPFYNPDDRTLQKLRALGFQGFPDAPIDIQTKLFLESADEVLGEIVLAIEKNTRVGIETVLSSQKYCPIVESVLQRQGYFGLIYIALSTPNIAIKRVASRVKRGGHGIPDIKVEQRWKRSLEYLPWFASRASAFWIFDNSDPNPLYPPVLVATGQTGSINPIGNNIFPELLDGISEIRRGLA